MRSSVLTLAVLTLAAVGSVHACEEHRAKAAAISLDAPAAAPAASPAATPVPAPALSASAAEAAAADHQHHDLHHEKHPHQGH